MIKLISKYNICGSKRLIYRVGGKYSFIISSELRGKELRTKWGVVKVNKDSVCIDIGYGIETNETKRIIQSALSTIYDAIRGLSPREGNSLSESDNNKEAKDSQNNEPSGSPATSTAEQQSLPSREGDDIVEKGNESECPKDGSHSKGGASAEEADTFGADKHTAESSNCPAEESGLEDESADSVGDECPSEKEGDSGGDRAQTGEAHSGQSGVDTSKVLESVNSYLENFGGINEQNDRIIPAIKKLYEIPKSLGGGGGETKLDMGDRTRWINPKIKEALIRLASGEDISQKQDGFDFWDSKKIAIAVSAAPHKIGEAKYKRPPDTVYFFVDTSGSVAEYGDFIIRMIKSSCSERVKVFSGSEAHPEVDENLGVKVFDYTKEFSDQMNLFLKTYKPEVGSTFVFWGDLHDANITPEKTKKVLKGFRLIWLHSCGDECDYYGCERVNAIRAGFKVIRSVKNDAFFTKALNNII